MFVCGKGMIPKEKCTTNDKHWTLLGLTAFTGQPVMCIVIFAGEKTSTILETGMDIFAQVIGNEKDDDFFDKNYGPGKLYPGGPTCEFKGKKIPCLVRWSPKGSITSEILVDILKTLDFLDIFVDERAQGKKPFLLLDGHGSRFGIPFLKYINDKNSGHEWVCCIGVPYGTSLWQVGDSTEQNGCYKMACTQFKRGLMKKKEEKMMTKPTIYPYEIMLIVNFAWSKSFANKDGNLNAICERGWYPYNRNILTYSCIRSSMTHKEVEEEIRSLDVNAPQRILNSSTVSQSPTDSSSYDSTFLDDQHMTEKLNFKTGTAAYVLDTLVRETDKLNARNRINNSRMEGTAIHERIMGLKKATAGKIFSNGTCRLGESVFQRVMRGKLEKAKHDKNIEEKFKRDFIIKIREAKKVKDLKLSDECLSSNQLLELLRAFRPKKSKQSLPARKSDRYDLYQKWKSRENEVFSLLNDEIVKETHNISNENQETVLPDCEVEEI